ncbi:serine/threonine-protein kinase Nek1 isoform X3 [Dunckerocampus dactyliophorus]|uniref:serine/threonine-protein kinase Nek1 isoform X3 n=1 Tax=Dunckerocampus dactyliophorus TaxID=161453 RepID=UPI002406A2B7|nr:serine/threonine-protein kinase Nek1 isoform X3 [Dunckerocampus dactyliophorus]
MDKYVKVKKIGEGSFGKAALVKSKEDGHQYVIKEISISGMSAKERQESRKEVAVLANMSHPNIVQYKESFEEGGCLYIVMDYCEGGDLFKKINSQRGILFSEEQILDWFVQICLAIKHIHDRKILHRDIKSQNIFLTKDGTVQLGDFGIARVLNSTVELARTCIGTPYYLSPEICENKPYNNKSDIWALGCVLYEMCTLKHAFEAGNMKNLVLKIIRGSYPPVSVHYSQELRSLLAQLFKHNPRERPSVSSILDKPFLSCRIQRFLTPQVIAQEFHHTFIHKHHKMGAHQGSSAKRPAHGSIPSSAAKITKPACKYGVPLTARKVSDVTKKPAERKPAVKHKPAPHRRVSQGEEERRKQQETMKKRKLELTEKEKNQKEQMLLLKAEQVKRYEKEKISRINHAREQGWKNVLISSVGSPERKCYLGGGKRAAGDLEVETYHNALDQMAKQQSVDRGIIREGHGTPTRNVPAAAGPVLPNGRAQAVNAEVVKRQLQRLQHISKQSHISRQRHFAVERAYQVEEFLQRKKEAMLYKVRAEGQLGTRQNRAAIFGGQVCSARFTRPKVNKEEEEYLARLKQIRLQNFNERQQIKARLRGEKYDSDGSDSQESSDEAQLRRKKIAALKAQANVRAAVLKEQLEKKRREAHEREKKAWDDHIAAREGKVCMAAGDMASAGGDSATSQSSMPSTGDKTSVLPEPEPSIPVISMTAALKNVGAITPIKETPPATAAVVVIQSEKRQILNRLNLNLKVQSTVDEVEESATSPKEQSSASQQNQPDAENPPPSEDQKKNWDPAEPSALPAGVPTSENFCVMTTTASVPPEDRPPSGGDRKKWEAVAPFILPITQQTLEETCIPTIEQTVGEVMQMGALPQEAQRKVWGPSPASQVLKVLQEAEVQPLTQLLETVSMCEEAFSSPDKSNQIVAGEAASPSKEVDSSQYRTAIVQSPEGPLESAAPAEASHPENASGMEEHTLPQSLADIQEPADVESMVLEDVPKASHPSTGLHHAWEKEAQEPMPPEGDASQGEAATGNADGPSQGEEPLFTKLRSPAHRRTSALALLSAQSSVDESSSSIASRSRSVSPLRSKQHNALLIGLSTGMFDSNNPKMLRTCSLPDLSRIFSSQRDSVMTTDDNAAPNSILENEDQDEVKDDDQSETEDVYEDEDLREIRASMERLLHEENDLMRNTAHDGTGDFNGNPNGEDEDLFNRMAVELEQDNNQMAVGDDDNDADDVAADDDEGEEEDEEDEDRSNGSPGDEEAGELLSNGVGEGNNSQLNEEWHSDSSEEEGEAELYDSIFSRLEEHRFNLEQQMGFEKFIEAYNKIKAIRDDEDDNIDLGSSLAFSILGTEHQHLYPNILHLVMADGAYQEGNDKCLSQWSNWQQ